MGAKVCLALAPGVFFLATCRLPAMDLAVLRGCRVSEEISFNHVQEISGESVSSLGQLEESPEGDKNQIPAVLLLC